MQPKNSDNQTCNRGAILSPDRVYRYVLTREWDYLGLGTLNVIGLNPSTADETQDDPTIRRCIGYAKRWRFGRLVMTNLFALRSTYPAALYEAPDPVGPENDTHLIEEAGKATEVLCAWGAHGEIQGRGSYVARLLKRGRLNVFGFTQNGQPKHPLYLRSTAEPNPWVIV